MLSGLCNVSVQLTCSVVDENVQLASHGKGPLWQRDYWSVIKNCRISPQEIIEFVREQFEHLSPKELVQFACDFEGKRPLDVGDTLKVKIRMSPECAVRVVNVCNASITLATLKGHPEAGKITFGAYRNDRNDVIFHIRSRARSGSRLDLAGFLTAGDPMQTNTWSDFIDRLAHSVGDGVIGEIVADKREVQDEEQDADLHAPTYIARIE